MMQHLSVLQVVIPLIAAPITIIIWRPRLAWAWATIITWVSFFIALSLLEQVGNIGTVTYAIGDWAAPWGIEYKVDWISALVLVIVSGIGSVVMPFAYESVRKEISEERIYLFYCMYLLALCGLLGMAITGDAFNLFVFLEISSLSSYVLIALGKDKRALTAAYRYLVMGTIGATFYIIGVGLMYMMTGTLNIADLATLMPAVIDTRTIAAAIAFLIVGLSLKLALFPLHFWLPNAYAYAPSVVTAFLAATATKVAIYALVRILFTVFGQTDIFVATPIEHVLMALAVAAIFFASAIAIFQTNVKRLLAYSSLAQIGYMVLGISFISVTGLTGGLIHLFNHAIVKCALFLAMGCIFFKINSVDIKDMVGIGQRMPFTMAAFVVAGLGLIGVPLTSGFISKWYLIQASLEDESWLIAGFIVGSSLLAVIYIWKIVEVAYFKNPVGHPTTKIDEAPISMLLPLWIMTAATVYFGIDATTTSEIAGEAAKTLLGLKK
jgi:multicomponent Na+:H+ antiporter subunit D